MINQLIQFELGTRSQIIKAIQSVNNRNDINEVVEYLTEQNEKVKLYYFCIFIIL